MAIKNVGRKSFDTYFKLVKQFPLIHIRNRDDLDQAQNALDRLLTQNPDLGTKEYLDALTDLIETYEADHEPIPDASEADVLRELMRSNDLSQSSLAKKVGISQSTISAVLNGNRSLTKEHIMILADFFHISPAAFLKA